MSKVLVCCARARLRLVWVVTTTLLSAACGEAMTSQGVAPAEIAGSMSPAMAGATAASVTTGAGAPASPMQTNTEPSAGARAEAGSTADTAEVGGMSGSTGHAAPSEPTFTNVYNALFAVSGIGGCFGCHGGLANPALNGNLAMLSDQAVTYQALVSAMSSETSVCGGMTRVTPGEPMASLLYLKLAGEQPCGMPMPPGTPLSADIVDMVEAWIAAGAQDN